MADQKSQEVRFLSSLPYWRKLKGRTWEQRTCSNGDILQECGKWPLKVLQLQSDGWAEVAQLDEKTMSFRSIGLISFDRLAKAQAHTDWLTTHKDGNKLAPNDLLVCVSVVLTKEIDQALWEKEAWDRLLLQMLINVVS